MMRLKTATTRAFSTVWVTTAAAVTMNPFSAQGFVVNVNGGGGGGVHQRCSSSVSITTTVNRQGHPSPLPSPSLLVVAPFSSFCTKKTSKNNDNGMLLLSTSRTRTRTASSSSTRLFSSFRKRNDDDNNNNDEGFLGKLGKVVKNTAKAILPSSWFQSEKEQKAAIERKRVKNQLSRDMNDLLKDAPLAVRMLGSAIAPLLGNVMSGFAETMAEQQQVVNVLLEQAQNCLENDDVVASVLGSGTVQVGSPFSQSSSSTSINGMTQTRVELAFPVSASRGSGVARLTAANNEIQQLVLQTSDGRTINVNVSNKGGGIGGRGPRRNAKISSSSSSGDIIEAEIIEKDTTKR